MAEYVITTTHLLKHLKGKYLDLKNTQKVHQDNTA